MKNWFKKNKTILLAILGIVVIIVLLQVIEDNAVQTCVSAGNDYNYCVEGLE